MGCAAPRRSSPARRGARSTGNQIGALLTEYLLDAAKRTGTLTREHYVVKTLVTTELIRRIADAYGVQTVGDLLVGFKYIGGAIDDRGPAKFVLGAEESYGFLVGTHCPRQGRRRGLDAPGRTRGPGQGRKGSRCTRSSTPCCAATAATSSGRSR